jgi:hypothetical protein
VATYPVPAVGQRLTAEFVTSMLPQTVRKAADTGRTSTIVRTADPDLALAVEANATYELEGVLFHSGVIAAGISILWTFPASTTGLMGYAARDTSGTGGNINDVTQASALSASINFNNTSGTLTTPAIFIGQVITSGTAGTLTLTWAQAVSNVTATTLLTNSYMKLTRTG